MPTELEELVEFLHHGNTQIRQIAAENLVGYSTAQPTLFKRQQLEPIKDLKLLIKDYPPIAKNAVNMLINLSEDSEVLKCLMDDDEFLESLFKRVTDVKETNADMQCMLLANMAKASNVTKLLKLQRPSKPAISTSALAIDQLLDCFVKGAAGSYNKSANFDYLSYLFADLAKEEAGRQYFLKPRDVDNGIIPLSKIIVFTEHTSAIRRRGVANTIKNVCFDTESHDILLRSTDEGGIGLLPYILLPLMGSEDYDEDDTDGMLEECQLLPPDKERDSQTDIICTHVESLLLLSSTGEGRIRLRAVKVYPIIRELHQHSQDQDIRDVCDRLVQLLMRGEPGDPAEELPKLEELPDDEDDQIVEIA